MKYRKLDENFDYTFIQLEDTPETVAQAVLTRLKFWKEEWFLNLDEGTPWVQKVMGHTKYYDLEIKERILDTKGVKQILNYVSVLDLNRNLVVNCTIETNYGNISISI